MLQSIIDYFKVSVNLNGKQTSLYSAFKRQFLRLGFTSAKRIDLYTNVKMLLQGGNSKDINGTVNSLCEKYRKYSRPILNQNSGLIAIFEDWQFRSIALGANSVEMMNDYIPKDEQIMFLSGHDNEVEAFTNVIKMNEVFANQKNKIKSLMAKPIIWILSIVIAIYVTSYIFPQIIESFPHNKIPSSTLVFYHFTQYFIKYNLLFLILVICLVAVIIYTIDKSINPIRLKLFDYLPPWSIYKSIQSVSFLVTLSLLLKSGMPVYEALENLRDNSNRYLSRYIILMLNKIEKLGQNAGIALTSVNLFNSRTSILVESFAESDQLISGLDLLATKGLNIQLKAITKIFNIIGFLCFAAIIGFTLWLYFAIYSIYAAI